LQASLGRAATGVDIAVATLLTVLTVIASGVARFAYLGFGWRTYSRIACDPRLEHTAELRMAVAMRTHRFSALVKMDALALCVLAAVGIVAGVNPGDEAMPTLIAVAAGGAAASGVWLAVCHRFVVRLKTKVTTVMEVAHPAGYIAAAVLGLLAVDRRGRLVGAGAAACVVSQAVIFAVAHTMGELARVYILDNGCSLFCSSVQFFL
jgi:hypothetical protein